MTERLSANRTEAGKTEFLVPATLRERFDQWLKKKSISVHLSEDQFMRGTTLPFKEAEAFVVGFFADSKIDNLKAGVDWCYDLDGERIDTRVTYVQLSSSQANLKPARGCQVRTPQEQQQ